MKQLKNLNEINLENISPKNLYCLGVKSYHFHFDIYETDYYYYILYDNELLQITFDIFNQILNKFGYNVKRERYHYQFNIIEIDNDKTNWKNEYKDNFKIVDDRNFKDMYEVINNANWLKAIFKIR